MDWGKDLSFLLSASAELEGYLLSEQLFWPLGSGERLSLGKLLLVLMRVQAVDVSTQEHAQIVQIEEKTSAIRQKWQSNWSKKAAKEFSARLRQWEHSLGEALAKNTAFNVVYRQDVTWRVLLSLLEREMLEPPQKELAYLSILDQRLQAATIMDEFVWEPELKKQFPQERFWFLYIKLRDQGI